MITFSFPINLKQEDQSFIKEMQKKQSSMIRSVYKMAERGYDEKEMRALLNLRFEDDLDSWFKQSAIYNGKGIFASDKTMKKSSRIFGGKKNFIRRCKNLMSEEEWKLSRLLPLYIVGESPANGNRKFIFTDDVIIFKPYRGKRIEIQLPKLKKNYEKKWNDVIALANDKKAPITVSLTSTHINLSFKEVKSEVFKKSIETRYAGVDLNPNYIGISVFDGSKIIATKMFDLKELTGKHKNEDKIKHETREVAHEVGRFLKHNQVSNVYTEELNFKQGDSNKGKNFNRLTKNQWKCSDFTSVLSKYFILQEINAAYSSTIGNIMNPLLPDPVAASAEIARRGNECYKKKSKKFYPELPSKGYIEDLWKKTDVPMVSSWKELHDFLKNSKVRYRVPIPERMVFRIFRSRKSWVYKLDDFIYN